MTEGLMGYFGMTEHILGLDSKSLAERQKLEDAADTEKRDLIQRFGFQLNALLEDRIWDEFEQQVFLSEEQYDLVRPSEE